MNKKYFFIGVAGVGMSAIAQFLANTENIVQGSDRLFEKEPNHYIRKQLENEGIKTFVQGEAIIEKDTDFVVISTAIEPSVPEFKQALDLKIPIIHRSEMLKKITESKKTIAVAGTSGKSTTTALIYTILLENNFSPSMINGSGLVNLQKLGKIGNSAVGKGEWLVIEGDESDGTLINYSTEIGIILNIDRDHKEFDELMKIFAQFASQVSEKLIVNIENQRCVTLSQNSGYDFGTTISKFFASNILQKSSGLSFTIQDINFFIPAIGLHNVENATAAIAVCNYLGLSLLDISKALIKYEGIDRRMQILGTTKGVTFIDDYAHNPAKIESAIRTAQVLSSRVFAFFQSHGFAPLKFFKDEMIERLKKIMRSADEFYLSEIYYAGGTASKTINSDEVVEEMKKSNINTFLSSPRNNFAIQISEKVKSGDIVLIMGARDPSLGDFAIKQFEYFKNL